MPGPGALRRPSLGGRPFRPGRVQWFALGGALVILAGVLVTWALSTASGRVEVVRMAQTVPAGQVFSLDDLTVTGIAIEAGVEGLVPASAIDDLVGRVAAREARAGSLVQVGMWREGADLDADEYSIGARLSPGHFPAGLGAGDLALAAELQDSSLGLITDGRTDGMGDPVAPSTTTPVTVDEAAVPVRVLDVVTTDDGYLDITLAVPASSAVDVARWAANDQMVLIGVPMGAP